MDCGFCNKSQRRDNMRRHVKLHVKQASEILNTKQLEFCLANKTPLIVNQNMIACMICGKFEITSTKINEFKRQYQINHIDCITCFDSVKKYYTPSNTLVSAFPDSKTTEPVSEPVKPVEPVPVSTNSDLQRKYDELLQKYSDLETDYDESHTSYVEYKKRSGAYKTMCERLVDALEKSTTYIDDADATDVLTERLKTTNRDLISEFDDMEL